MALEDLAMFRSLPGCTVFYPSDAVATERAIELAANTKVKNSIEIYSEMAESNNIIFDFKLIIQCVDIKHKNDLLFRESHSLAFPAPQQKSFMITMKLLRLEKLKYSNKAQMMFAWLLLLESL